MADQNKSGSPGFTLDQLLHPELLSTEALKMLLIERCIQLKKMENVSREELLAIVYRVAVPLPQRSRFEVKPHSSSQMDVDMSSSQDTTKKEISCINFERKTIKLKSGNLDSSVTESANGIRARPGMISLKRKASTQSSDKTESTHKEESSPSKKRTKITWP